MIDKNKHIAIISAIALHILCLYILVFIQDKAYQALSTTSYMGLKMLLRWGCLIVPLAFMKMSGETLADIGFTRVNLFKQIAIGALLGMGTAAVIILPTVLLGYAHQLGQPIFTQPIQSVFYLFYTIFGVGLLEELFFRGFIYKRLLDLRQSKWFAMVASSLVFGVCHIVGHDSLVCALPQVGIAFLIGAVYCILREKINGCTIISLIVMHGAHDFLVAFAAYILA